MKKLVFSLLLAFCLSPFAFSPQANAQTYYENGYKYLYDYDHRIVVRECVACTEDYQDLWNGDYVRLRNNRVYIYSNGTQVTWGDRVWLEHTGQYTVKRGSNMYLQDAYGNDTGVWGNNIYVFWNGVCSVTRGNNRYLYTSNNYRLGSVYSNDDIYIYWNGYYAYHTNYWHIADPDGQTVSNTYSDEAPDLTSAGYFKCYRNGQTYLIDTRGNRVY